MCKSVILILIVAVFLCHVTASRFEMFDPRLYLAGPTKCFSCERYMIARNGGDPSYAWLGKPSKCFDCEKQMASYHPNLANMTHGTKCFSCENQ